MKIAIVVFLSFSLLCFSCISQRNVTIINKIELSEILKSQGGNITLIDVRTVEEF